MVDNRVEGERNTAEGSSVRDTAYSNFHEEITRERSRVGEDRNPPTRIKDENGERSTERAVENEKTAEAFKHLQEKLKTYFDEHENHLGHNNSLKANGVEKILQGIAAGDEKAIDKAVKAMHDPASGVYDMANCLNSILADTGFSVSPLSDQVTGKAGGLKFSEGFGRTTATFVSTGDKPSSEWFLHPAPPPDFNAGYVMGSLRGSILWSLRDKK